MMPDCTLDTVLLPITPTGSTNSTRGSCAVDANNACAAVSNPGAIAPPRYSPFADTASTVMAVPKSTITLCCPGNIACAATALAIRSAPTSRGLSVMIEMPVLTPGSTTTAGNPK